MDITFIKDISIVIGLWIAIYGIDSWRREFKGKRQIELAEDTLASFYEASDAISHIRNIGGFSNEFESVEQAQGESEAKFKARKQASVVFYRYNQHNELFRRLYSMRYRFMAAFGREKATPFDELNNVVNEIIISARMLGRLWAREYFPDEKSQEEHRKNLEKHEAVFWFQGANDEITSRVNAIVGKIDTTCSEIILGKGTLYYLLNWKLRKKG